MIVNPTKLDQELRAAGIPIHGCSADGRIDFMPSATAAQRTQAAAIEAAHDPAPSQREVRIKALGLTVREAALIVVAKKGLAASPAWVKAEVDGLITRLGGDA